MRRILPVLFLILLTGFSCTSKNNQGDSPLVNLDAGDFREGFMQNPESLLLDVRTIDEYNEGHIPDSLLIPVQDLDTRIGEIESYKNKPVYVYCRSGNRSLTAANYLVENGFSEVYNLLGGINGWKREGFEVTDY